MISAGNRNPLCERTDRVTDSAGLAGRADAD
jgi:hypothetical protein